MRGVHHEPQRIAADFPQRDALGRRLPAESHEAHIQRFAPEGIELVGGEHLAQLQPHRRVALTIRVEQVGQRRRVRQRGGEPDAQLANFPAPRTASVLRRLLGLREDSARMDEKAPPRLGERHPPLGALEQAHAEFVLQVADLHAERGLPDMYAFGCAGEVELLGHGNEIAQVTQFHLSTK